jgi:acyl dehydratase
MTAAVEASPDGRPRYAELEVGQQLPTLVVRITRADLIRYAGASCDFNTIHWSDRVAAQVGLPGVIAHGMLTMAQAVRVVTDWTGDPSALTEFSARFAKPVLVPDDDDGAEVEFTGQVAALLPDDVVRIDLTATCDGERVLTVARAFVRLP